MQIHKLSIAPMIDWSNSPFRILMRLLAREALVYTEMQSVGALLNKPRESLFYLPIEAPIALQIGGCEPKDLAICTRLAVDKGFDEVNLNLGCPSERVLKGRFGASLMKEPKLVFDCINAMKQVSSVPISAKIRIGVDTHDSYEFFHQFATQLIEAGCDKLIIHARKAWLKGLNPKQNRTIPPINYDYVYRLKKAFPHIPIIINGDIKEKEQVNMHLEQVNGVMIGRLACENPYSIATLHESIFQVKKATREAIVLSYLNQIEPLLLNHHSLRTVLKPLLQLAHSLPGARLWKQYLVQINSTKEIKLLEGFAKCYFNQT